MEIHAERIGRSHACLWPPVRTLVRHGKLAKQMIGSSGNALLAFESRISRGMVVSVWHLFLEVEGGMSRRASNRQPVRSWLVPQRIPA